MERYKRQINLPQVGDQGQQKLQDAKVLVIGAGGLGNAVLPYLTASGIRTIGIVDGDKVELSNLHRQVLFSDADIGKHKADIAARKLKELNSDLKIKSINQYLSENNAISIINEFDVIVDATDSIAIRYLINDACVLAEKPFVYGSIYRFEGQVSVFNYKNGPTYRCLFKNSNRPTINCEEAGVLGTTVGIIGMFQANEVIKIILETGDVLSGKLLIYNILKNSQDIVKFKKDETIKITEDFYVKEYLSKHLNNISAREALTNKSELIDVREHGELPEITFDNLIKMPLSRLETDIQNLSKEKSYAIFCQHGIRSQSAAKFMINNGFHHVNNITDGAAIINNLIRNEQEKSIH